ncbi:MAG: hypothetical protein R3C39_14150 [Dehalococcoidia bacterium]
MSGVVHVVAARLRADLEGAAVERAVELARGLGEADDARAVVVGRSETQLLVATWLPDRASMERFASSVPHMAFIMRGVASVTNGMWSAAAEIEESALEAASMASPASMWVFGVHGGDEVYEWQVRRVLDGLRDLRAEAGVVVACGSTFEERDRFRAAGVVLATAEAHPRVDAALSVESARWAEDALAVEVASAGVAGLEGGAA